MTAPDLSTEQQATAKRFGFDKPEPRPWNINAPVDYTEYWSDDGGATRAAMDVDMNGQVVVEVGILRSILRQAGFVPFETVMVVLS